MITKHGYTSFTYGGVNDWQSDFAELVNGAMVIILADNDKPGIDIAKRIYEDVVSVAKSVKIMVPMPDIPEGDVLTVYSIDRLGRNYTEIMKQWQYITQEIKADIRVLDMPLLDTRNNGDSLDSRFVADLVLQILSYVAQKERENIKVRQSQGIAVAKEQGKHLGRPAAEFPDNWEAVYNEWKSHNITAVQAMKQTNLKKNTFYNLVKRYENK